MANRLYAIACAGMFVFGITLSLPGTVLGSPETIAQLGLSLVDRGTLIAALFVGLLIGSVLSGPIVDRLGQRTAFALSAASVAVCLPLFALSSTFATASASLGALGLACAGVNTASNALTSDLFPLERGRRMNGVALVVGLGGLALPTLTALASAFVTWRAIVFGSAGLAAVVAIAAMRVAVPIPMTPTHARVFEALSHFARQPRFAWFCVIVMLAAATEASMAGWTSTYLASAGFSASAATWALSSHWLGLVAGRVIFSGRVDRAKGAAIARSAVAGSICIGLFAGLPALWLLALLPFAIGVAIAVVMPTALALAGEHYPGNAGTLFGILLTLAQVGGIVMPALIGIVASRTGIRSGLSLLILNGVVVAIAAQRASRTA